jgi:hypothetical protein
MFPIRLGMAFAFIFGIIFGAVIVLQKCSFRKFFSFAHNKEALVSEYMDRSSPRTLWNLNFIRDVHDWEIESLDSFLTLLYSMNSLPGAMNSMMWTPSSRHSFAMKSYYTMLNSPSIEKLSSFP